jgi:hypothetical protein
MPLAEIDMIPLIRQLEAAGAPMSFETWRGRKREARIFALFLGLTIPIIAVVLPLAFVAVAGEIGLPMLPAIAIAGFVAALALKKCWDWILLPLRFCIIFHPERLQIGRGLAKCSFPYQDVELLFLIRAPIVKVRCNRTTVSVWLAPEHKAVCFTMLRYLCCNAVLVDESARSHLLPANPTNPKTTLAALEGHYKRRALIGSLFIGYLLWLVVMSMWGLMQWQNGNVLLRGLLQDLLLECLVGFVLITIGGVVWRSWRIARAVRHGRAAAATPDLLSGEANHSPASNHFASHMDDAS